MAKRGKDLRLTREQQVLASTNLNLARDIAWKYQRSTNIEYHILESAAFEGLCQAAARYDPNLLNQQTGKSMKFSSLAVPYIRGSILHYIRDKTYSMRLTHRMRELWVKGRRMLNCGMTDIEICQALLISLTEWQDTKSACSGPPLELKDQTTPTEALEPDEIDCLTPFREEAAEALSKMSDSFKERFAKYCKSRAIDPPKGVRDELARCLKLG